MTEWLSARDVSHSSERDPLVDNVISFVDQDLPRASTCGEEARRERERRLKEQLLATQRENDELRQQVQQQFQDLEELSNLMGELEVQVDCHEAVIKQQGLRIQEQEEVIQQMNATTQQYVAALLKSVLNNRRN